MRMLIVGGVQRPLTDWARLSGMSPQTLWWRINAGWSPAEAVSTRVETQLRSDITGQRFGGLIAVAYEDHPSRRDLWKFRCDCGEYVTRDASAVRVRGYRSCGCHRRSGSPEKLAAFTEKFWSLVSRGPDADCWEWQGYRAPPLGYGITWMSGKHAKAHRVAWMLSSKPLACSELLCHHCDNPPCCNPSHMFVGDHQSNRDDCVSKGRQAMGETIAVRVRGEAGPTAKLTECDVLQIRAAVSAGEGYGSIAKRFGVTRSNVSYIARGKTWRHLIK